ncbi:hypothetical protein HC725_08155 [Vibrio sp. S17_S38]|uniref:hypothetical protein n=1 Tax=Vibrio sp. S17_S38 TaxID=2720229 RepID=UPI0016811B97|nr:hypothetical protein [Vibrio sp. S17_S38]MBD1573242.1 hypothetical protein [Vibrio sp. S17_S38]
MKKVLPLVAIILFISGCTSTNLASIQDPKLVLPTDISHMKTMCIFDNIPNLDYENIRDFKAGKGTYGSVANIMPKFIHYADRLNANTVIDFHAGQRFGFWPWRIVRPVAYGTAVKWKNKSDSECKSLGGRVYAIESNKRVYDMTNSELN